MSGHDGEHSRAPSSFLAALWEAAARASEDAIFGIDDRGLVHTWTRSAARLFGYDADEAIGRPATILICDKEVEPHGGPIDRVLAGERIERLRLDVRRGDGMVLPVALTLVPLPDGRGSCVLARDLTEQQVAQATLAESDLRLREAQQLSRVGLWLWDEGSGGFQLSDELYRIHGVGPLDFDGTMEAYLALVHPDDRDALHADLDRGVTGQATFERQYRILRPAGAVGWVHARASLEVDEAGVAVGLRGIAQDITERKMLEAELESARDRAMELSQLKSDFLTTISHEIRTPMNGVIGMTGLLLDTQLDHTQREFAETVCKSGNALLTIINDILDFSKIEAGKVEIEVVDFDLRSILEEVACLLAGEAHEKGLELVALLRPDVHTAVRGDPGRLRQILINLIGNAIKFTEDGEVVVRVDTTDEAADDVVVRVQVADTGIGIRPESAPTLFDAFSQADSSTTRRFGGSGLGLAISQQLVGLMGGQISVESEPGRGSTFTFTVRMKRQPQRRAGGGAATADQAGLRVLVVDGNAATREGLVDQLTSWKMTVATAADGPAALDTLRSGAARGEAFDVALVDVGLPAMGGIALAGNIGSDRELGSITLILLTSAVYRGPADARPPGVSGYLMKPVRQSHLHTAIATLTGANRVDLLTPRPRVPAEEPPSRPRILVVDDNVINQLVAVAMLTSIGYEADVVADGREAVDAFARGHYGAVLMDCQMPVMDGYTATRRIRELEQGAAHIPIIAVTAGAMKGDREKCLDSGMDDYLAKPVSLEDLTATVRRWIDGQVDATTPASSG